MCSVGVLLLCGFVDLGCNRDRDLGEVAAGKRRGARKSVGRKAGNFGGDRCVRLWRVHCRAS